MEQHLSSLSAGRHPRTVNQQRSYDNADTLEDYEVGYDEYEDDEDDELLEQVVNEL